VSSALGSLDGIEIGSKLATSVPRILQVMFKWFLDIITIWLVNFSILEFNKCFHIIHEGDAGAWRSRL